jgi:hypothetical protein
MAGLIINGPILLKQNSTYSVDINWRDCSPLTPSLFREQSYWTSEGHISCTTKPSLTPIFNFPPLRMAQSLSHRGLSGSTYVRSKSGWMNKDLLVIWLKYFVSNFQTSIQKLTLLITDNHSSHMCLSSFNFCKDNGMAVIFISSHT